MLVLFAPAKTKTPLPLFLVPLCPSAREGVTELASNASPSRWRPVRIQPIDALAASTAGLLLWHFLHVNWLSPLLWSLEERRHAEERSGRGGGQNEPEKAVYFCKRCTYGGYIPVFACSSVQEARVISV